MKALEIEGWCCEADLAWIAETARESNVIVEIGCWKGRTTVCWAEHTSGLVLAVDHFKGSTNEPRMYAELAQGGAAIRAQFRQNTSAFSNIILDSRDSSLVASTFRHSTDLVPDVVFLDGDHQHDAVLADIRAWRPLVKPGGLLCGHDIHKVQAAVAQEIPDYQTAGYSIWWWRKPNG